MNDTDMTTAIGYDFFADVEGTRSVAHILEAGVRFQTSLNALQRLQDNLSGLPARLQLVHEQNLMVPSTLGQEMRRQTHRFQQASEKTNHKIQKYQRSLEPPLEALWQQIEQNDGLIGEDGYEPHAEAIARAKEEGDGLKLRLERAEETVYSCFNYLANQIRALEQQVAHLEQAVEALEEATFELDLAEILLKADQATYHLKRNKKAQGMLFLSDKRLIFEQREEVQKKFLFFNQKRRIDKIRFHEAVEQITVVTINQQEGPNSIIFALKKPAKTRSATFSLTHNAQSWQEAIELMGEG
jgi:hypothetical protein